MRARLLTGLVAGLSVAVVVAACGGGETSAGGSEEATPTTVPESSAPTAATGAAVATRDACTLVSDEAISAMAGEEIVGEPQPSDYENTSECYYAPPGTDLGVLYLKVSWVGGIEEWETWKTVLGLTDDMLTASEGVSLDDINVAGAGPVPGLGDAAYYGGILPSYLLVGDVLVEINMPLLLDPEVHFPEIAQLVLASLSAG